MFRNVRYALRMLRKNPGFSIVAICSLAIGIGATSAIYSLAYAMLLRPIPVPKPSEIVALRPLVTTGTFGIDSTLSYPDYVDLRDRNHTFQGLVAAQYASFGFSTDPSSLPRRQFGMWVSGNTFDALHVLMAAGRGFRPNEDKRGQEPVVVLGYKLWQSEFNGSASVVGKTVRLNGIDFRVVGVAPEKFSGIGAVTIVPALYVPISLSPRLGQKDDLDQRGNRWLMVKGRLRPGVNRLQAQDDVEAIAGALAKSYPATNKDRHLAVRTELQLRTESDRPDTSLLIMLALLALCVLLVACANVGGLLLSRSTVRAKEIAIRLAIGANRRVLTQQLLIENFLLALAGGAAGLLIAYGALQLFRSMPMPTDIPLNFDFELDRGVLLFTLAMAALSTLIFGLAPAFHSTKADLIPALKTSNSGVSNESRLWGRNAIVVGQVALSLVLLLVAGVMVQGFRDELAQGPGFRTDHLYLTSLDPELVHYTPERRDAFYRELLDKTRNAPGVVSAALCSTVPMGMGGSGIKVVPENFHLRAGQEPPFVFDNVVSDRYFEVTGIRVLEGRPFLETDKANTPAVAIVNQQFAKHYWPRESAIGKKVHLRSADGPEVQIVGVAKTAKYFWIAEAPSDFLYLPFAQNSQPEMTLMAQSATADASGLGPVLRHVLESIDRTVPTYDMRTFAELYEKRAVKTPNMILQLVASLGTMALILSVIGLYGLIAYTVSRRYKEIGIRMAIGADRKSVLKMVLRKGAVLGGVGTVIGLAAGAAASRAMASMMVTSFRHINLLPFPLLVILLLTVTLLAAYLPARRASIIDPMTALREE
jgi:predicted permease